MTPSERERRIEAAAEWVRDSRRVSGSWQDWRVVARGVLDAADKAMPMVGEAEAQEIVQSYQRRLAGAASAREVNRERAERAEAAARDFRAVLAKMLVEASGEVRCNCEDCMAAREAIARHPSFSGEEGTGP